MGVGKFLYKSIQYAFVDRSVIPISLHNSSRLRHYELLPATPEYYFLHSIQLLQGIIQLQMRQKKLYDPISIDTDANLH